MRVLHVQDIPCIRMFKIVEMQRYAHPGWKISIASRQRVPDYRSGLFSDQYRFTDVSGIVMALSRSGPIDIVHVHNEPDELTAMALDVAECPVIHDAHDLTMMRFPNYPEQYKLSERRAQEGATVVSYPTSGLRSWALEHYAVKRSILFESRESERNYIRRKPVDTDKLTIVYEGGIGNKSSNVFPYRKYSPDFTDLANAGFKFHIYPKGINLTDFNDPHKFTVHRMIPHEVLIEEMAMCNYAFVGFSFDECNDHTKNYCNNSLPNKFFDALCAGIPIIVRNCGLVATLVKRYGLGLVYYDNPEQLYSEAKERYIEFRNNVLTWRPFFSMEQQFPILDGVYLELCQTPSHFV